MFSRVVKGRALCRPACFKFSNRRSYLSNEFTCTKDWQSRLEPKYMKEINLENLYYNIEQSFQHLNKASAVDIDVFMNRVTPELKNDLHLHDEIFHLLHKLRLTEETSNALDSTSHAVIRNYIDMDCIKELLTILDDRINYGVFLDHYIAIYAINYLIKRNDFTSAARIATTLMLQEDFSNELSKLFALYSCYRYLDNPEKFYDVQEKTDENEENRTEVKVRVKFIRNEFFDDHFDLRNHYHLVGKTLIMISENLPKNIAITVNLVGQIYYEKYDEAMKILSSTPSLHYDSIDKCLKFLEINSDEISNINELRKNCKKMLLNISNKIGSLETEIEALLKESIKKHEKPEIEKQKNTYLEWNILRQQRIDGEIVRLSRAKRLQEIEKISEEIKAEEQKLWFFENKDKIDLQIDSKKIKEPETGVNKTKKAKTIDESYIPPEITKQKK